MRLKLLTAIWITACNPHNFIFYDRTHVCKAFSKDAAHVFENGESTNKSRFRFSVCYPNGVMLSTSCVFLVLLSWNARARTWFVSISVVSLKHDISIQWVFLLLNTKHFAHCIWYFMLWPMIGSMLNALPFYRHAFATHTFAPLPRPRQKPSTLVQLAKEIFDPSFHVKCVKFSYLLFCLVRVATINDREMCVMVTISTCIRNTFVSILNINLRKIYSRKWSETFDEYFG